MKTTHITKVCAVVMAMLMLLSMVPTSVLPVFAVSSEGALSIFDTVALGKGTVTNTENYKGADYAAAPSKQDAAGNTIVNDEFSPYEPYATNDEDHPFLSGGAAYINLKEIYYGVPATPNVPLTEWSANTSVVNITGTGKKYTEGIAKDQEIYAIHDLDMINEYLWANYTATVGGKSENGVATNLTTRTREVAFYCTHSDKNTNGENVKFYTSNGDLLDFKWNDADKDDNIDETQGEILDKDGKPVNAVWKTSNDGKHSYYYNYTYNLVESKDNTEARVYNRYDAMQGKWGLTLDKNVSSVVWTPTYVESYYGMGLDMNNSELYLNETPYFFFSTEAPDSAQISISLLIGAPVQSEKKRNEDGGTVVKFDSESDFEYRWYTITDNALRPGVGEETLDYSMVPNVTISDVVLDKFSMPAGSSDDILAAISRQNPDNLDPLTVAANAGVDVSTMFVDGAITGCIDFTQLLPLVTNTKDGEGRLDVMYKIAQVRIDTQTKARAVADSAVRVNYMYFGPGQAAILTPQSTVGNDVNGANWMYAQNDADIGDQNPNFVATASGYHINDTSVEYAYEGGYTNGWHNGQAVSIVNTPNTPQLMTIDTYGQGYGELITKAQYKTEMTNYYKANGAVQAENGLWYYNGMPVDWLSNFTMASTDANSKIWKYVDANGKTQYLEAEYNQDDKNYYVMVTIPVRKWINVLGDSRKLSMKLTSLEKGKFVSTDPSFCFWGNNQGALGSGHQKVTLGSRWMGEDILGVFGKGYYNTDTAANNKGAFVDYTFGESVFYNQGSGNTESWFDWLRSPYIYDRTVTDSFLASSGSTYNAKEEMIGYTFVTSMRFVMPVGSKISVQSTKGDGNSAGLNTYSTSGEIVSAYDGGSGAKPVTNVDNSLPEKTVTIKHDGSGKLPTDFTYTQSNYGDSTLKGTISGGSAAYGPMLPESRYTIYDLLDTEYIKSSADESHASSNVGKSNQPVLGQIWKAKADYPIYPSPSTKKHSPYGYVISGSCFVAYAIVIFSDNGDGGNYVKGDKWALTGVVTDSGTPEIGWVQLWDATAGSQHAEKVCGSVLKEETVKGSTFDWYNYSRSVQPKLDNMWVFSNAAGSYSSGFRNKNNTVFYYGVNKTSTASGYNYAKDLYSTNYNGMTLKYANMWSGIDSGTNSGYNVQDAFFRTVNGTDLEIGMKRSKNTTNNWSIGLTRTLTTPITLTKKGSSTSNSYPVLYLDYTSTTGISSGHASNIFSLNLLIDNQPYLYYVQGKTKLTTDHRALTDGNNFVYLSFEDIMNAYSGKEIKVVGVNIYFWRAKAATLNGKALTEDKVTIRRFEILQAVNDWYDEIYAANQEQGGTGSTAMNSQIQDSIHIINDSFFNTHDEADDGSYTLTKTEAIYGSADGINGAGAGYKFTSKDNTNANSYVKNNSNKGWKAYIRMDTNGDGQITAADETYYSFDNNKVEGKYEYHTSVGNLRIWAPAGMKNTSVVFEADRSFNTKNFRYLYYSYSMRDVDAGIAAEESSENRSDGKVPGMAVAIKSTQFGSASAYSEIVTADGQRTWAYYDEGNSYWAEDGRDNRTFKTTINAAADLSTFDGIESVNQFVFYLSNPLDKPAEFYINYIILSNVAPEQMVADALDKTQNQYYYMMDNTGDRYSARFPTIDNPTGQVTGTNCDNDRVNPIIIERGQLLSNGTYFNGDRLYGYGGTSSTNRTFNDQTGTQGYYEKTYGNDKTPNADGNGSMKNIFFYAGESDDLNDISDYYTYKDRGRVYTYIGSDDKLVTETVEADGKGDIYDMVWSYGRWLDNSYSALNILYIGDPSAPAHQKTNSDFRENAVSGGLTRRYATENYVLLRSGIEPKKYETYFDANGGEYNYEGSSEDTKNLAKVNENSYFLTQNVIMSYYEQPGDKEFMGDSYIRKPGYTFLYWEKIDTSNGKTDAEFTKDVDDTSVADGQLMKYIKKNKATVDYFKAVWMKDPDAKNTTATFKDNKGNKWFTRSTNIESENGTYAFQIPAVTNLVDGGVTKQIYGWKAYDKNGEELYADKVFSPGDRLYLLKDVEFSPVLNPDAAKTFTITLTGAKLFVHSVNGNIHPIEDHGVTVTTKTSGGVTTRTYKNVPANYHLRAVPDTVASNGKWTDGTTTGGDKYQFVSSVVVSTNKDCFDFGAYEDRSLSYTKLTTLDSFYTAQNSVLATNTSQEISANREVCFYGKFEVPSGATVKAFGTLFTVKKYFDLYDNGNDADMAQLNTDLRLDASTINATTLANKSYSVNKSSKIKTIKFAQAAAATEDNEFLFTITGTTNAGQEYYARTYVIYTMDGKTYKVAYGDVVAVGDIPEVK